mmetsp:Transcript_28753/g.92778  ORF Transcript_28753/g.92778 Transcript_28753/m.92778 type:complete len:98 (-) Transcript_28753:1826-2119(-)
MLTYQLLKDEGNFTLSGESFLLMILQSQIVLIMVNLNSKIKHTNIKMTQKINGIEMKGFISMIHLLMPQRSQEQLRNLRERWHRIAKRTPRANISFQ